MLNKILLASAVRLGLLEVDVSMFSRMLRRLREEAIEGLVDQLTLVIDEKWSPIEMELYSTLIHEVSSLGVIIEARVVGDVNLATLDMLLAGMEKEATARKGYDALPNVVILGSDIKLSLDRMESGWVPQNMPSSLLYNALMQTGSLGGEPGKDAGIIHDVYSGEDFGLDVDIFIADDPMPCMNQMGSEVILRGESSWVAAPISRFRMGVGASWAPSEISSVFAA